VRAAHSEDDGADHQHQWRSQRLTFRHQSSTVASAIIGQATTADS
jgi:hypothetical protein